MKERILVWERLGVPSLLWSLPALLAKGPCRVLYAGTTPACRPLLRILKKLKLFPKSLERITPEYGARDENGRSLRYTVEERAAGVARNVMDDFGNTKLTPSGMGAAADDWPRILQSFCCMRAREKLVFLHSLDRMLPKDATIRVWIGDCIAAAPIRKQTDSYSTSMRISVWPSFRHTFLFSPFPGIIAYLLFQAAAERPRKQPEADPGGDARQGGVLVEHISNIFDRYPDAGLLFWHKAGNIPPERIHLFRDRCRVFPDKDKATAKKHGFSIRCLGGIMSGHPRPVRALAEAVRRVPGPTRPWGPDMWRWSCSVLHLMHVERFRRAIRETGCRITHQHQEFSPKSLALALAARQEGAVSLWFHWSVDHYPISAFDCGLADLLLSWGPYNTGYFNCHTLRYGLQLETGLISGDAIAAEDDGQARTLRSRFAPEVEFVIAVFDTSHHPGAPQSTASMLDFYTRIVRRVADTPDMGLIIKPKGRYYQDLPETPGLQDAVRDLEAKGRCLVADGAMRVTVAAKAADASVCYGINSAGFLAALAGCKVLHADLPGTTEHPLYHLGGKDIVVFNAFGELFKALDAIKQGNQAIGDHAPWLSLLDPFRDGRGPEYAGRAINAVHSCLAKGGSVSESLDQAAEIHARACGQQSVIRRTDTHDRDCDLLWRKVRNATKLIAISRNAKTQERQ